ncbi:MAG: type II toxin-antitoxin system VapC family toxin [Haloechinothrix sp.]
MSLPRGVVLDTSVVIDLEKLDLSGFVDSAATVSAITVAELAYGLDTDDPVERAARTERYYATLTNFDVLPFDTAAAKLYGVLASLIRRAGRNPRPRRMGLQIAATAGSNSLPLLTRNAADFAGLTDVVDVLPV